MSLPPKTDDEISAPDEGAKPAKRGRPRARKAGESDTDKGESAPAIFVPEARSEPQAPSQGSQAPQAPSQQDNGGSRDVASEQGGDGRQGDGQGHDGRHGGGQGGSQGGGQGGGRGEWQDRNSWKRNKRKRGRHGGGQWQPGPGGGGGGGGNAPRYPQQPPPPSPAPVYGDLPSPSRFDDVAALDALAKEIGSAKGEPLYLDHLYSLNLADLTAFARTEKVAIEGAPNRLQLLPQIFAKATEDKRALADRGYVDMTDQGAFIVHEHVNYRLYPEDAYLPESLIRRYGLKRGHHVEVRIQPPQGGERCPAVIRIDKVMGHDPEDISKVTPFEELVPYYPLKRILLEDTDIQKDVSMRAVDILTPIGFGQRGLIVAPPRTGKTILLQNIANSVSENSPFAKLILLLVDERPEEVTDFRRHTKGEVVSSTFDESPESHVHCAEMVGEKARRLVEQGEHVVILLDSITRLARAYNALAGSSGKIMSGGLESNALQKPKRFFGAARNIEGAGSLTIIATALVDTGSRADEIIFEEFKGTGNMELHLDRGLVERRIFPAINIDRSGTRKEELIYHPEELQRIYGLRRAMQGLGPIESMEMLIQRLKKTKSNAEFLLSLSRQ
jgi:transcription termination factor Rho